MSLGAILNLGLAFGLPGLAQWAKPVPQFVIFNVPQHTELLLAMSISGTEGLQLYEGYWSWLMDEFSQLRESTIFLVRLKCDKFTVLMLMLVCLVTNMQRFLKVEILQKPWRKFSHARVDESLVKREAAATSLLHSIGWEHSHCTFNTLCWPSSTNEQSVRHLMLAALTEDLFLFQQNFFFLSHHLLLS